MPAKKSESAAPKAEPKSTVNTNRVEKIRRNDGVVDARQRKNDQRAKDADPSARRVAKKRASYHADKQRVRTGGGVNPE